MTFNCASKTHLNYLLVAFADSVVQHSSTEQSLSIEDSVDVCAVFNQEICRIEVRIPALTRWEPQRQG